ncbi:LON peptidase substrate-binding domain-containing protein [Fulvivirgaceae bacterium LMO-SS25]
MKLALFPPNLVPFPKEKLNLHIFEPRYKQLIGECLDKGLNFGIPSYIDNKIEYGTEVQIAKVEKLYDDGRMDISVEGLRVFKVLSFNPHATEKLYPSGIVSYLHNIEDTSAESQKVFYNALLELFLLMNLEGKVMLHENIKSFEIAHKMGLTLNQEYELLLIESERERQDYLLAHIRVALPILQQMQRAQEIIKMNGHFRYFNPLKL